jgi:formamidopyrimidine-DNA glycosylase
MPPLWCAAFNVNEPEPLPELPEVETVRLGLLPSLQGRKIVAAAQMRPDLRFPFPADFPARLAGRRIDAIDRRAKYLLLRLDDGETLIVHLGMTGRFTVARGGASVTPGRFEHDAPASPRHEHLVLSLDDGTRVGFADARRFGYMVLAPTDALAAHPLMRHLGLEPLGGDLTAEALAARLQGRRTSLKAALMDQRIVAGLGNIYASEALHRARLSPLRSAGSLVTKAGGPRAGLRRLAEAAPAVLKDALRAGGSTLRDFQGADGLSGLFQHEFAVYGREGASCPREACPGTIRRIVQSARSTFYCPACQR